MSTNYLLSSYTTAIRQEGGWTPGTYGGFDASITNWSQAALYLKGTATDGTIGAKVFRAGNNYALYQFVSGAWSLFGRATLPNDSTWADTTLFTGLNTTTEQRYLLQFSGGNVPPGGQYVSYLTIGNLNTNLIAQRDTIGFYGNSVIEGIAGTGADASQSDAFGIALALDMSCEGRGYGGTTVKAFGAGTDGESRTSDVISITPSPKVVLIRYGLNDSGQIGGAETPSDLQAAYITMLTLLTAGLPNTIFWNESIILTVGSGYPTDRTPWSAAIQNAVNSVNTTNGNANCKFVDISVWSDYTAQTTAPAQTVDGVHPNQLGYSIIVPHELAFLRPPSSRMLYASLGRQGIHAKIL